MNKKYWQEFYKKGHTLQASSFAKFCKKYIPNSSLIMDLGCGNGRDSYYLSKKGEVIGVDNAVKPKDKRNTTFDQMDLNCVLKKIPIQDVLYSRFFIHSITDKEIENLLKWNKGLFMAEFRSVGDEPVLYKHERNLIDGDWLLATALILGYEILYYNKSKGLAKYKNEDPLIGRIICRRKH